MSSELVMPEWEEVPDDVRVRLGDYVRAYWVRGLIVVLAISFFVEGAGGSDTLAIAKLALLPAIIALVIAIATHSTVSPWTLAAQRRFGTDGLPVQWLRSTEGFSHPYALIRLVDGKIIVYRRGFRVVVDQTLTGQVKGIRTQMRIWGPWTTSSGFDIEVGEDSYHFVSHDNGELSYRLAELGWVKVKDRKDSMKPDEQAGEKILGGRDE